MRCGIYQRAGEGGGKQVAEGILRWTKSAVKGMPFLMRGKTYTLLKNTAHETSRLLGEVFERSGRGISVETTHGNAEEGTACKELAVRLGKAGALVTGVPQVSWGDSCVSRADRRGRSISESLTPTALHQQATGKAWRHRPHEVLPTPLPRHKGDLGTMCGRTSSRTMNKILLTIKGHLRP